VLEHRRVRTRTPLPQDSLQFDQTLHSSHRTLALAKKMKKKIL
jgi:hypothetical protein